MKRIRIGMMLIIVVCMTLFVGTVALADGVPACKTHTVGDLAWPADYTECGGGYKKDVYACAVCNGAVHSDGTEAKRTDGTGIHKAKEFVSVADYTECDGGYKEDYYECECGIIVNKNGEIIERKAGNGLHTAGELLFKADYTECGGGYKKDVYECSVCKEDVFQDGSEADWEAGTGNHTPGTEIYKADYTECGGGFKEDYYLCVICDGPVNANGKDVQLAPPIKFHSPGNKKYPADYTECGGGFKEEHYICTVCGWASDERGINYIFYPGNGKHKLISVPAKEATTQATGNLAYWKCEVCDSAFKDQNGKEIIKDINDYIVPKLAQKNPTVGPQTGDQTPLIGMLFTMMISFLAFCVAWSKLRRA